MKHSWIFVACALGLFLSACNPTTPAPPPAPEVIVVPGQPQVVILSPSDNAVVDVPQVEITGQAAPGTVLTFNEEITVADQSGHFTATVPLDEGPNAVEMVASDAEGRETNFELTVIYEPQN